MTNYQTLQNQIAFELGREDLTLAIKNAIQSAIWYYQTKDFGFNREFFPITTKAKQEKYKLPDDCLLVLKVSIMDEHGARHFLKARAFHDDYSGLGMPIRYVVEKKEITFSPIPLGEYRIDICCLKKYPPLLKAEDTNPLLENIYELLRVRAKAELYLHHLHNYDYAKAMKDYEETLYQEVSPIYKNAQHSLLMTATAF